MTAYEKLRACFDNQCLGNVPAMTLLTHWVALTLGEQGDVYVSVLEAKGISPDEYYPDLGLDYSLEDGLSIDMPAQKDSIGLLGMVVAADSLPSV